MAAIGQIEKKTQSLVVRLFRNALGYDYLDDWGERRAELNRAPLAHDDWRY